MLHIKNTSWRRPNGAKHVWLSLHERLNNQPNLAVEITTFMESSDRKAYDKAISEITDLQKDCGER